MLWDLNKEGKPLSQFEAGFQDLPIRHRQVGGELLAVGISGKCLDLRHRGLVAFCVVGVHRRLDAGQLQSLRGQPVTSHPGSQRRRLQSRLDLLECGVTLSSRLAPGDHRDR